VDAVSRGLDRQSPGLMLTWVIGPDGRGFASMGDWGAPFQTSAEGSWSGFGVSPVSGRQRSQCA
jgi:hypothetical protein